MAPKDFEARRVKERDQGHQAQEGQMWGSNPGRLPGTGFEPLSQ